jgi:hypothetical protein
VIALASVLVKPTVAVASAAWGILLVEGEYAVAAVTTVALLVLVVAGVRAAARGKGAEGRA